MRCEHCGNFGIRNNAYCDCPYGTQAKIKNGDLKMDPRIKEIVDQALTTHDKVFKRLARE
jgi:tRNA G10  N-methylase Trm11